MRDDINSYISEDASRWNPVHLALCLRVVGVKHHRVYGYDRGEQAEDLEGERKGGGLHGHSAQSATLSA